MNIASRCPRQPGVIGVEGQQVRSIFEVDAFQAMQLTLRAIGGTLMMLNRDKPRAAPLGGDENGWFERRLYAPRRDMNCRQQCQPHGNSESLSCSHYRSKLHAAVSSLLALAPKTHERVRTCQIVNAPFTYRNNIRMRNAATRLRCWRGSSGGRWGRRRSLRCIGSNSSRCSRRIHGSDRR
jgi:hypothetical protein